MNVKHSSGIKSRRPIPETTIEPLAPFGVQLTAAGPANVIDMDVEWLHALVLRHKIVVLRGFERVDRNLFIAAARSFGALPDGDAGQVLDDSPGRNSAPFQWDGLFARVVPRILLFHCLEAPAAGGGGETVFCDTNRAIAMAKPRELAEWRLTEIVYRAGKNSVPRRETRQALFSSHPVTGASILRFAEPSSEGDPVLLEIRQFRKVLSVDEVNRFVSRFCPHLHRNETVYAHRWRNGDFVLSDNHALLHARRLLLDGDRRHVQRIHIL